MRVLERVIEYKSRSDWLRIVPLFDLHLGNAACDEKLLRETVEDIAADPMCWWIGGADYADFINKKDRRYKETAMASWLWGVNDISKRQIVKVADVLKPIKNKCLCLLKGNHEEDILMKYERDVYTTLVDLVKPDGDTPVMMGVQGFLRLRLRMVASTGVNTSVWTVIIYLHHGYGGGRLEGGDALALGRIFKDYDCDIALMGHRHKRHAISRMQLSVNRAGSKIRERHQVAAFCGSFLKGYSEDEVYPENKGLPPQPLGPVEIRIQPDKKIIKCIL
jgi:predicted phosphodiesterase